MRLILVRHGQTRCNVEDIWHGWDDCELTETGQEQARATAARLAGEPIAAVYSSDTRRALQTAEVIAAPHGLRPITDPGLRERRPGEYEGVPAAAILASRPTLWKERSADYWGWRPPGGESMQEVLDRALAVLDRIYAQHPNDTVAVVSHMGATRVLISKLAGLSMEQTFELQFPSTGVSIFTVGQDGVRVEALNDATHAGTM